MKTEDVKFQIEQRLEFLESGESQVSDAENAIKVLKWVLALFNYDTLAQTVMEKEQ